MVFGLVIAWVVSTFFTVQAAVQVALTVAAALYQRRRQKKLEANAAAEAEKQKGFMVTVFGEPIHLPRVYGYQSVAGVRAFQKVFDRVHRDSTPTGFDLWTWYPPDHWTFDELTPSSKNAHLITQQAFCVGGIDGFIDIEINGQSWNKGKFREIMELSTTGGVASPMATLSGLPATNLFSSCAWCTTNYVLNRDDYNFQGVPEQRAFVRGMKVWKITSSTTVGVSREFSNNNAECLLDYLLAPKELGGFGLSGQTVAEWESETALDLSSIPINLASFYNAKLICDTVVKTVENARGRVNGIPDVDRKDIGATRGTSEGLRPNSVVWHSYDGGGNPLLAVDAFWRWRGAAYGGWELLTNTRTIKLYECNLTVDTERNFRDNIELFLETMGEADLIFSEGKYKMILNYPEDATEQDALITATYDDSYIVSEDIAVTWASAGERWNRAIVKFNNEETDFTTDSVAWPEFGDLNHQALLLEDNGVASETSPFVPGITHRELALAKAENIVRSSRLMVGDNLTTPDSVFSANQKVIQLTLDRRALIHDVGDLIKINSVDADIIDEVYKIEELNYVEDMNVSITAGRFNYTNLTYSDKVTVLPNPHLRYDDYIEEVTSLTFTAGNRTVKTTSNGWLSWTAPVAMEDETVSYKVYTSTDEVTWELMGQTPNTFFDIDPSYDETDRYFLVKVINAFGVPSEGTSIFVDTLSALLPLVSADFTLSPAAYTVHLAWDYSSHALVGEYEVYYSTVNTKPVDPAFYTPSNSFTVTGLEPDTQYYFWVDVVGESGARAEMVLAASTDTLVVTFDPDAVFGAAADVADPTIGSVLTDAGQALVTVTWVDNVDGNTKDYVVTVDNGTDVTEYIRSGSPLAFRMARGTDIDVTLVARNAAATPSTTSSVVSHTTATDSVAPVDVAGLTGVPGFDSVWLSWTASPEEDLSHYELFHRATDVFPTNQGATFHYTSLGEQVLVTIPNDTNFFWVRAVDTSGNRGDWTGGAGSVTNGLSIVREDLVSTDIAGIVDEAAFAASMSPTMVVDTLPATGNYDGRQVFLTTDKKVYRFDAVLDDWTARVDGGDVEVGTLDAGAIIAGSITSDQLASNSVLAKNLAVGDFSNIFLDPNQQDDTYVTAWDAATVTYESTGAPGYKSDYNVKVESSAGVSAAGATTSLSSIDSNGEELYYEFSGKLESATTGVLYLLFRLYTDETLTTFVDVVSDSITSTSIDTLTGTATIPAGYKLMQVGLVKGTAGTATFARFGRVVIRHKDAGTLIVDGSITGDLVAANSLLASHLKIGSRANLLDNSEFYQGLLGVNLFTSVNDIGAAGATALNAAGSSYAGRSYPTLRISSAEDTSSTGYYRVYFSREDKDGAAVGSGGYPIVEGGLYEFSAKISAQTCYWKFGVEWFDNTDTRITADTVLTNTDIETGSSTNPELWTRFSVIDTAPVGAVTARPFIQLYETTSTTGIIDVFKPLFSQTVLGADPLEYTTGGTTTIDGGTINTDNLIVNDSMIVSGAVSKSVILRNDFDVTLPDEAEAVEADRRIVVHNWFNHPFVAYNYDPGDVSEFFPLNPVEVNFSCMFDPTQSQPTVVRWLIKGTNSPVDGDAWTAGTDVASGLFVFDGHGRVQQMHGFEVDYPSGWDIASYSHLRVVMQTADSALTAPYAVFTGAGGVVKADGLVTLKQISK